MKKITILAAFALMTTAAFAQTEQTKRQVFYPGNNADNVYTWTSNWTPQEDLITDPFAAGDYGADRISLFVDSVTLAKPEEKEFTIDFNEVGAETPGIEITADSVRYNIRRSDASNKMTGAGDGAQLVKDGEGAFYTDVELENMSTVLKNGTLGRYKRSSAEYKVFGNKIVVSANTKAKLVLSDEKSENTTYFPSLNVDSLILDDGAEVDFYLPAYGKMRADTTVYVSGNGTINFYTGGKRFFAGGNKACKVEAPANNYRFDEDQPGAWYQYASSKWQAVSKWEDYPTDFSDFKGTITIQNDLEKNDSTPCLFILPAGRAAQAYLNNGSLYDIWKAAEFGDEGCQEILNRYSLDWRNVDVVIKDLGCLCDGSSGTGGISLLRVKSLNVEKTGLVSGYYKDSEPKWVIMTGSDDADARIDGTFTAALKGRGVYEGCGAGIIKEGHGTYYITAIDNMFACGIDVYEGGVMFNNPDPENTSATGQSSTGNGIVVTCREYGHIGGTGTIGGTTELYGTLYPGDESVSAFRIDGSHGGKIYYQKGAASDVAINVAQGNGFLNNGNEDAIPVDNRPAGNPAEFRLHNGAEIVFDVNSKDYHDTLLVQSTIYLMDSRSSDEKVKISLTPHGKFNLAENDTIVLMHAEKAALYTNSRTGFLTVDDFELEVSPEYKDAKFELGVIMDTTVTVVQDPVTFIKDTTITSRSWELVAVATSAGSGDFTPAAIQEPETETETMQVYPNPAVDNVTVALPADVTGTVAIYNLSGQLVKSVSTTEPAVTVNVDDLTAGVYTVRVQTADKSYVQRLVVK